MPTPIARREFAKSVIDQAIRKTLDDAADPGTKRTFVRLLWNVQARSGLLRPRCCLGRTRAERLELMLGAMLALASHSKDWLRPVEDWVPMGTNPLPLFSSLAHHLLAYYPVPPVLLSTWFRGTGWHARRRQGWFKHVGQGGSLRTAGFPIRLTRRMAHEFAHAPAHCSVEFALRWAQVRGLGGPDDLARAVASTRLGQEFDHDEFWATVILFFINQDRLDPSRIGPIVEYLHDQKFVPQRAIIGEETEVELDPPQPDLTLKGRTIDSLWRRVAEWQARRRPGQPERRLIRWARSGIGEYRREDESGTWTIRELLDSDELAAEGQAMHHCVATYTAWCARRQSTIWSLGLEGPEGRQRTLTIEVDPETRAVLQAKMRCNDEPDEWCRGLVDDWARDEGLTVSW